jgi:hypothetical protein
VKKNNGKKTDLAATTRISKRKERVNELLLQGYNARQIALTLGISANEVRVCSRELEKEWQEHILGDRERHVARISEQFQLGARSAFDSYLRSRQDATETTTIHKPKQCQACNGTGKLKGDKSSDEWCVNCDGDGKIIAEITTTKVKGQAGDSTFLKEFRMALESIAKIQGLNPEKAVSQDNSQRTNIGININLSAATPDELLNAKVAFAKLQKIAGDDEEDDPKLLEG